MLMSGGYPPEGSRWLPTVDPGKGEYETAIVIPEVYLVVVVVAVVRVCNFDHSTPPCVPPFPFPPLLPWGQPALCRGFMCKIKCGPSTTLTSLAFLPFPDQCMVSIPLRFPPFPLLPWGRPALCRGSTCKIKCGPSTTLTSLAFLSFS